MYINYYIQKDIKDRLDKYCEDVGQTNTMAIERILKQFLDAYEANIDLASSESSEIIKWYVIWCSLKELYRLCDLWNKRKNKYTRRHIVKILFLHLSDAHLKENTRLGEINPNAIVNSLSQMGDFDECIMFFSDRKSVV